MSALNRFGRAPRPEPSTDTPKRPEGRGGSRTGDWQSLPKPPPRTHTPQSGMGSPSWWINPQAQTQGDLARYMGGDETALDSYGDSDRQHEKRASKELDTKADASLAQRNSEKRQTFGARPWSLGGARIQVLAPEEFDALNARQQAAVQSNTALVEAKKADESKLSQGQDADYKALAQELFGGDVEEFAPQTLAVLKELGVKPGQQGQKLGDILGQRSLVSDKDLTALGENPNGASRQARGVEMSRADLRLENASQMAKQAESALARTLKNGQSILQASRGDSGIGGLQLSGGRTLDDAFDILARRSTKADGGMLSGFISEVANEYQMDPREIESYFANRVKAAEYGATSGQKTSLGRLEDEDYYTPEEFRALYYGKG